MTIHTNNTNIIATDLARAMAESALAGLRAEWEKTANAPIPLPPPADPAPIPDQYDKNDARMICRHGDIPALKAYLDQASLPQEKIDLCLQAAAKHGHIKMAELLLKRGADIHSDTDFPLQLAASYGRLEMAAFLLDQGADIHCDDDSILGWAVDDGAEMEMADLLITRGAPIKYLPPEFRETYDNYKAEQLTARKRNVHAEQTLSEIFKSAVWVGHVPEMIKLWEKVPAELQNEIDFSHALSDTRAQTMKQARPRVKLGR